MSVIFDLDICYDTQDYRTLWHIARLLRVVNCARLERVDKDALCIIILLIGTRSQVRDAK